MLDTVGDDGISGARGGLGYSHSWATGDLGGGIVYEEVEV